MRFSSMPWERGEPDLPSTMCSGSPAFLVPASQLLGGPVRFWHDQLFCKPAHLRARSGLAPGLLLLDAHRTHVASYLLDRARRQRPRQSVPRLCSRKPSLEAAAGNRSYGNYYEIMTVLHRTKAGLCSRSHRIEARTMYLPPSPYGAWILMPTVRIGRAARR